MRLLKHPSVAGVGTGFDPGTHPAYPARPISQIAEDMAKMLMTAPGFRMVPSPVRSMCGNPQREREF